MTEEWRDLPGFPSYQISSLGRIMRIKPTTRARAGYIKAQSVQRGSMQVMLHEGNKRHRRSINKLMGSAFSE
jgi:hypothetical protein